MSRTDVVYHCRRCLFRTNNGIEFVRHIFDAHGFETTFRYWCRISSCTRVFMNGSSYNTFRGHCTRKHRNWQHNFIPTIEDLDGVSGCTITDTDCEDSDGTQEDINGIEGDMDGTGGDTDSTREDMNGTGRDTDCCREDVDGTQEDMVSIATCDVMVEAHDPGHTASNSKDDVKKAAAKFILTLKEKFKLTQVSLDYTVKAVEELLLLSNKCIEQSDSMLTNGLHPSPFDELKTEYQQTKFFRENFGLVVSGHIFLIMHAFYFLSRNRCLMS